MLEVKREIKGNKEYICMNGKQVLENVGVKGKDEINPPGDFFTKNSLPSTIDALCKQGKECLEMIT